MVDESSSPEPPAVLSESTVDRVDELDAEELAALAEYTAALSDYASALSAYRRSGQGSGEEPADDVASGVDADAADRPDDVPAKASTTVKEINGNRYEYWQWRDGETIRSQYKGPADAAE